jgi:hypothetical protein
MLKKTLFNRFNLIKPHGETNSFLSLKKNKQNEPKYNFKSSRN